MITESDINQSLGLYESEGNTITHKCGHTIEYATGSFGKGQGRIKRIDDLSKAPCQDCAMTAWKKKSLTFTGIKGQKLSPESYIEIYEKHAPKVTSFYPRKASVTPGIENAAGPEDYKKSSEELFKMSDEASTKAMDLLFKMHSTENPHAEPERSQYETLRRRSDRLAQLAQRKPKS